MGRFPQLEGTRGSQKWIQKVINERPYNLETFLSLKLQPFDMSERVHWLSPLKQDDYAEYRDEAFLDLLRINLDKYPLNEFWPRRGPQWDALGRRESTGEVFLVEAKSHIPELISSLQATDRASKKRILDSLNKTKVALGSKTDFDWTKTFYQYANRLAHLHLLRMNGIKAYLIFVCFTGDYEMGGPSNFAEWEGAFRLMNRCLGLKEHVLSKFVVEVPFSLRVFDSYDNTKVDAKE